MNHTPLSKQTIVKANREMLIMWATCKKCWMCKHKFDKPVILTDKPPVQGKLQPAINAEVLFHMYETHGTDPEIVNEWIIGTVYGLELTDFGIKRDPQGNWMARERTEE